MVSFRGQKRLGHAQIGLLYGFNSKFPTSLPTPFICGVPPPPPLGFPREMTSEERPEKFHNDHVSLPGNTEN